MAAGPALATGAKVARLDPRAAHRRAALLMVATAVLWSTAGVVTRWLSPALVSEGRFEVAFWRSVFAALAVAAYLTYARDGTVRAVRAAGWPGVVSGAMWAIMFSAFMLALTLTTVANTLVVMSVGPLITALLARAALRTPVPGRTWAAIAVAAVGIGWMFAGAAAASAAGIGMAVAFAVPLANAVNLVTLKKTHAQIDLVPAVLVGGVLCAALMLPAAWPLRAGARDLALLAGLGVFQLALPCVMMVVATRRLSAPEVALIGLLEEVLGPIWTWLGAGEVPAPATLAGGALVIGALVFNEALALRRAGGERP